MRGPRTLLYLLLMSLGATDALRVTMKAPLISVMRDEDVTIPCEFTEFTPGKTINVHWTKSQNGNIVSVFEYISGRPHISRPGPYMEEKSKIEGGNAALNIPGAQFSDEGEYTCIVVVTLELREGKSTLQVSAIPSTVLIPGDDVKAEVGREKLVSCDVSNFYPKDITIHWVRYEKYSSMYKVLKKGTCIEETFTNTDGTFNVTSHLTFYPTLEDDGHRYSCVVKHRSLDQDLMKNFTLTVTEREDNTGTIVTAVILTVLFMTLLLLAGVLYYQVITKDPPGLSEITGTDQLIDMNRTILTCHITNFKPNDLGIAICLKRRGEEMMMIHTWRSRDPAPAPAVVMDDNDGDGRVAIDVEQQRLMNGAVNHAQGPLQLEMNLVITTNRSGLLRYIPWRRLYTYSCQCSVHITPSYSEDDGAEFSVLVSHPALTEPISQMKILKVTGVPPTLLKMVSPVYMTHEEPMMLNCPINAFKPKTLHITWLKKDQSDRETEIVTWKSNDETNIKDDILKVTENEHEDKSYSFQSALMMRPNVREDGVRYICRTFHPATGHQAEEELALKVTVVPVLGPIMQTLGKANAKINVGDTMSLTCMIHSFYPKPIEVTWYTEDGRILPSILSDFLCDPSGLYHVTSSMTYTPNIKDRGKTFTCDVRHESTGAKKTSSWTLQDLVSEPAVSEIRCSPPFSECDEMVTLSCDVSDLYNDILVTWHEGRNKIPSDKCTENIQEDLESGTFNKTTEYCFMADSGCHEKEYRMELIHHEKIIARKYKLILKGFPILGDIFSDPSDPKYGRPVTLYCKVTNTNPQDIKVQWLKGEKPLEKGQGEEKQIPEEDGSVSCSLQIIATALDYGKAYTCSVRHKDMKEPLRKNHYIALPDKIPKFSDITVRPERLVAGQEATFTVTIYGFPPDIRVKWYKDLITFPSDIVTTSHPQVGKDFLCTCSSSLRFTPQDKDHKASIRCEATHSVTNKVYEKPYTLHLTGR